MIVGGGRKYIGMNDRNGTPLYVGAKIIFHFDEHLGYSNEAHPDYTTMNDVVIEHDGKYYFSNESIGAASFAWRHNEQCTIVSNTLGEHEYD